MGVDEVTGQVLVDPYGVRLGSTPTPLAKGNSNLKACTPSPAATTVKRRGEGCVGS